jgi:hypothetical protein
MSVQVVVIAGYRRHLGKIVTATRDMDLQDAGINSQLSATLFLVVNNNGKKLA